MYHGPHLLESLFTENRCVDSALASVVWPGAYQDLTVGAGGIEEGVAGDTQGWPVRENASATGGATSAAYGQA